MPDKSTGVNPWWTRDGMRTELFDFELPDELIALRPVEPRDAARLLVVDNASLSDRNVHQLPDLLQAGDVVVLNDTRVIPAALKGERVRQESRARISVNLHKRIDARRWRAFAKPARKLDVGDRVRFGHGQTISLADALEATVSARWDGGEVELAFDCTGTELDAAIAKVGALPLPPYIASKRAPDRYDAATYQTIFAARDGAVAAPTAALHFTDRLFDALTARGVAQIFLTLHVGAGTFLPVKSQQIEDHVMHPEWGEITPAAAQTLNAAR
ncbi:MAG: S-adenosylmethionine:tRNA ribosyltransferase-isomerase, partial [Hyphomicrobiaceae bacterium]